MKGVHVLLFLLFLVLIAACTPKTSDSDRESVVTALKWCGDLHYLFQDTCVFRVLKSAAVRAANSSESGVECGEFPSALKGQCYQLTARMLASMYFSNPSAGLGKCAAFPREYEKVCRKELSHAIGAHGAGIGGNPDCGSLPQDMIPTCQDSTRNRLQESETQKFEATNCSDASGLERDECLAFLSQKRLNDSICREIQDALVRSTCHRDVIFANELDLESRASGDVHFPFPVNESDCALVEDPLLRRQCISLYNTPRVMGFLEERRPPSYPPRSSGGCDAYDEHHRSLCLSLIAAGEGGDVNGAKVACEALGSQRERGECLFLVVSAMLDSPSGGNADPALDLCNSIDYSVWRWSCASIVASTLAQRGASIGEIAMAISVTDAAAYYNFLEPTLRALPISAQQDLCTSLGSKLRAACSWTLWWISVDASKPEFCEGQAPYSRDDCRRMVAWKAGMLLQEPFEQSVERCSNFSPSDREACFTRLGFEVGRKFLFGGWNLSYTLATCGRFPVGPSQAEDMRYFCYYGLGLSLDIYYVDDPSPSSLEVCDSFPYAYRRACVQGISRRLAIRSVPNVSKGIERCARVPPEFESLCLGELFATVFESQDAATARKLCISSPPFYKDACIEYLDTASLTARVGVADARSPPRRNPVGMDRRRLAGKVYYDSNWDGTAMMIFPEMTIVVRLADGARARRLNLMYSAFRPGSIEHDFLVVINGLPAVTIHETGPYPWTPLSVAVPGTPDANVLEVQIKSDPFQDEHARYGIALGGFTVVCGEGPCIANWTLSAGG